MPEPFLSEAWFTEVEKLRDQQPAPGAETADLTLNIIVTGGPQGDTEVHVNAGRFDRGLVEGAPTKVTVPYEVAKAVFIEGDQAAAMQAFMSGQIKVEGDMTKLMAMQGSAPDPSQQEFQQKLREITS